MVKAVPSTRRAASKARQCARPSDRRYAGAESAAAIASAMRCLAFEQIRKNSAPPFPSRRAASIISTVALSHSPACCRYFDLAEIERPHQAARRAQAAEPNADWLMSR
jgi:hypothetical protein